MRLSKILIGSLAAAAFAMGTAHAKEFRSSDVHPLDYPTVQAVMYMGKLISERSGGKNSVKVFGQSTL
ncbi:MAG TPA: TRAP transporter substrate-binding protein, partial [Dongiaceae bacterium]|nr:TRAP transporter substrate-binding protein [Dongiaceae bacterium]